MNDYDVFYVDGRNATATVDARTNGNHRMVVSPHGGGVIRATAPASGYGQPMIGVPGYPPGYPPAPYWGPHPGYWNGTARSSLLDRVSTGQLIDMVAQIFVALMPLPAQPVVTNDAATDAGNLILYRGSLASYAKRDEQVRTLGNLIQKLVG